MAETSDNSKVITTVFELINITIPARPVRGEVTRPFGFSPPMPVELQHHLDVQDRTTPDFHPAQYGIPLPTNWAMTSFSVDT